LRDFGYCGCKGVEVEKQGAGGVEVHEGGRTNLEVEGFFNYEPAVKTIELLLMRERGKRLFM
jgi:hypothetical protein